MLTETKREQIWTQMSTEPWDMIIVGGGITGAGIFREAARMGVRVLLLDQRDFAWGTSSRSSKLVHSGLRYLKQGNLHLVRNATQEREKLMAEAPDLIQPLGYLLASFAGDRIKRPVLSAAFKLYNLLSGGRQSRFHGRTSFQMMAPHLEHKGLKGGFHYGEATVDDARLVLRLIQEGVAAGGVALNYARAAGLIKETGQVAGLILQNKAPGAIDENIEAHARVVINATGSWGDRLRQELGHEPRLRPLRGSHLLFPAWRLPVAQAVSFFHPDDGRPVYVIPWEGASIVGTTDVDHDQSLVREPRITGAEVSYLMKAVTTAFPQLALTLDDIMTTYAGIRPVVDSGRDNPSSESRDHVVWAESGLLTVTGGKLTTFRLIAQHALQAAAEIWPEMPTPVVDAPLFTAAARPFEPHHDLTAALATRLRGRYGPDSANLVDAAEAGELTPIPGTTFMWAELRWAARQEGVVHLDDLLLRRVRLGLLLPQGAQAIMPQIKAICQSELGWDEARWQAEEHRYEEMWSQVYSLPARETIPAWKAVELPAPLVNQEMAPRLGLPVPKWVLPTVVTAIVGAAASAGGWLWWRQRRLGTNLQ